VMSPRVRNRGAESALCRLAAIESRGIDGASAPRTPQCAGEPPCVARDESANRRMTNLVEQKYPRQQFGDE
jgi:hypothetical protein